MKGTDRPRMKPSDPVELSPKRAAVLFGRAARLRCPFCAGGSRLASWLAVRSQCPACGLRTERGEEDYFLGAMMFNLVLSEGLLAVCLVALVVASWPEVPWTFLRYGTIVLMALAPFVFFPLSKLIWLAADIMIRPVTPEEMQWYRENHADVYRPFADR
jgi:uncharacterized protein (DUF983 family)